MSRYDDLRRMPEAPLNGHCPKRDAHSMYERCDLVCPDLPKVFSHVREFHLFQLVQPPNRRVRCRQLADLECAAHGAGMPLWPLRRHCLPNKVPYYLKVDIEDSDWLVITAISAQRKPNGFYR